MQKKKTAKGKTLNLPTPKRVVEKESIQSIVARKVQKVVEKNVAHLGKRILVRHLWHDRYRVNVFRDGIVAESYYVKATMDGIFQSDPSIPAC